AVMPKKLNRRIINAMTKNNKWTKIWFWTALISSWLTFELFFTSPFGLLLWIIVLIFLFIRKTNLKWYLISFSAWTVIPIFCFLVATTDYFTGQAKFREVGMPDKEFYNLDREYRVGNSTTGCIVLGFEAFTHLPNNVAVRLWTNLFGFQKGVYSGQYPDKLQTEKILEKVKQEVKFEKDSLNFKFDLDKITYRIQDTEHR
ncbi:MAG: hypothetical protein U5N85_05490, partial [Arcicella sp.]|nr:hypothetical protein [Arcicella sp.]